MNIHGEGYPINLHARFEKLFAYALLIQHEVVEKNTKNKKNYIQIKCAT